MTTLKDRSCHRPQFTKRDHQVLRGQSLAQHLIGVGTLSPAPNLQGGAGDGVQLRGQWLTQARLRDVTPDET